MSAIKMGLTIEEASECTGIGRTTQQDTAEWANLPGLNRGRTTTTRRDPPHSGSTATPGRNSLNT